MAFNGLTDAQAERLALLLEELGEAQQAIGKILRHGYESMSPFDETKTTNRWEYALFSYHLECGRALLL